MPRRKTRPSRQKKGARSGKRGSGRELQRCSGRFPNPGNLRAIYDTLLSYPNVVGCFLGHKHVAGHPTGKPALVCCVREKPDDSAMRPADRLPRFVRWQKTSTSFGRLAVDVEVMPSRIRYAASSGPGDLILGFTAPGARPVVERGTLGLAMLHPQFGHVVTTAGHVFDPRGSLRGVMTFAEGQRPLVQLANAGGPADGMRFTGEAVRLVMTRVADYAIVLPHSPLPAANLYQDRIVVGPPYLPGPDDLGRKLFVLTGSGSRKTAFVGLAGSLPIGQDTMEGLLLTEFATDGGDSGGCLVDGNGRLWGLLVGFTTLRGTVYSAFMSGTIPLSNERGTFL